MFGNNDSDSSDDNKRKDEGFKIKIEKLVNVEEKEEE
jgi:hypothetical protein